MTPNQIRKKAAEQFGKAFRQARGQRTQAEVAELLNIDPNYCSRIERGDYLPSSLLLVRALSVLQIDPSSLIVEGLK